jgi:hypothetical protein
VNRDAIFIEDTKLSSLDTVREEILTVRSMRDTETSRPNTGRIGDAKWEIHRSYKNIHGT